MIRSLINKVTKKLFRASEKMQKLRLVKTAPVDLPEDPDTVTVVTMVRNEALRLPFFFSYYDSLGAGRYIVLDHGSTDDTAAIADAHPNAKRIPVQGNFVYKTAWLEAILDKACLDHWVLVLDADEILVWPHIYQLSFRSLLGFLDENGFEALTCTLLDMYPKSDVRETGYRPGRDPIEFAPYFDCDKKTRSRIFGVSPNLNKVPLMRWRKGLRLTPGHHYLHEAKKADARACLLHFKFLQDTKTKPTSNAMIRLVDGCYHRELVAYQKRLNQEPALVLWSEKSIKFDDPNQLIDLGIMSSSPALQAALDTIPTSTPI